MGEAGKRRGRDFGIAIDACPFAPLRFPNRAIFRHLNLRDTIAYGFQPLKIPRDKQAAMVEKISLRRYGDRRAT